MINTNYTRTRNPAAAAPEQFYRQNILIFIYFTMAILTIEIQLKQFNCCAVEDVAFADGLTMHV